jgi:hypothetical protein
LPCIGGPGLEERQIDIQKAFKGPTVRKHRKKKKNIQFSIQNQSF